MARTGSGQSAIEMAGERTALEFEQVIVAEWQAEPGGWTVEVIDDDGGIEQAMFIEPRVRERAEFYAAAQYGRPPQS